MAVNEDMNLDAQLGYDTEDAPEGVEFKLTPCGGVLKTILKKGEGWEGPENGDEVIVHYTGTLTDGTKFDSSKDRQEPFRFKLGAGQVIKGWDIGVATMKRGESSKFTLASDFAYGKRGSPPTIPGGATLLFEVDLIDWVSNNDLTDAKDGGVLKKVITEGAGWEMPKKHDEAIVKYSVRVAGSEAVVASGDAAVVVPEQGFLCPAIGLAVTTMKKHEAVTLKVKPAYGFATAAFPPPPGVDPNASLDIELELTDFFRVDNAVAEKDGAVLIKTLRDGDGFDRPNELATVTCSYTVRGRDGTVLESAEDRSFTTDEEHVLLGLDVALLKMKKGATGTVYVHDAAYAGSFAAEVPLAIDVELKDFVKAPEVWDMDAEAKVAAAREMKEAGNGYFKAGRLDRAVKRYKRGIQFIDNELDKFGDLEGEVKELRLAIRLNLAQCHLKLKEPKEAVTLCSKILDRDATSVKALFRRALARADMNEFEDAEGDLKRAAEVDPADQAIAAELKRVRRLIVEQNKKDKGLYSKMFAAKPKVAAAVAAAAAAAAPAN